MRFVSWALIILALNVTTTALQRARSSSSLLYTTYTAIFAATAWIFNLLFAVDMLYEPWHSRQWLLFFGLCVIYVAIATIGSVGSQWFLIKYVEHDGRNK